MRMKIVGITMLFFIGVFAANAFCQSAAIKKRMIDRLPVIKELKAKGMLGETNRGYLDFVGKNRDRQDIVDAENADRKTVYKAIARQQGTTLEIVEKHRAVQIEEKAKSGEWLQDADGNWYKKK